MRLTRPRFTVWRMMVLVAVIAMILGGEIKRRQWASWSQHCEEKMRFHQAKAAGARGRCIDAFTTPPGFVTDEVSARYHDEMAKKWEVAARHPWSSVEADLQTSESASRIGLGWSQCSCNWCKEWVKAGAPLAY
jgi:hypothetical protein